MDAFSRGTINLGNTCYGNSLLRSLAVLSPVQAWAQGHVDHGHCSNVFCSLCHLHADFAELALPSGDAFIPKIMEHRRVWATAFSGTEPQCPREAFTMLMDGLGQIDEQKLLGLDLDLNQSALFALPAWHVFGFLSKRTTECKGCSRSHTKYSMENFLSMSVPIGRDVCVRRGLAVYEEPEELGHGDRCLGCGRTACRTSTLDIVRWPRVLMIHFKRWSLGGLGKRITKDPKPVAFSSDMVLAGRPYVLKAVIVHKGAGWAGGHYVAFCSHDARTWHLCDDRAAPSVVPWDVVQRQIAYMLVYMRCQVA